MNNEIVSWLRLFLTNVSDPKDYRWRAMAEAADEIEALRQQLAEKEALLTRVGLEYEQRMVQLAEMTVDRDEWKESCDLVLRNSAAADEQHNKDMEGYAAALAACKMKDEVLNNIVSGCYTSGIRQQAREALAIQPDTSALEAMIAKAGEKMRERCINVAWNNEPDCNGPIEVGIRALPGVTLEDLK